MMQHMKHIFQKMMYLTQFMNVMVQIVEKYGQSVLQDLDCVA